MKPRIWASLTESILCDASVRHAVVTLNWPMRGMQSVRETSQLFCKRSLVVQAQNRVRVMMFHMFMLSLRRSDSVLNMLQTSALVLTLNAPPLTPGKEVQECCSRCPVTGVYLPQLLQEQRQLSAQSLTQHRPQAQAPITV